MAPPYRIGKGPVVVELQKFLATGDVQKWYTQLADEDTYLKGMKDTLFDAVLTGDNKTHMAQDVFGAGHDAAALPADKLAEAQQKGLSRRLVYGRGMRRALEIAYGFSNGGQPRPNPWTIDLFWGCGQPFNSVALAADPANEWLTVIVYSAATATPGDDATVPWDPTTPMDPAEGGDLFFVDDRKGPETVSEWRATTVVGFADSPKPAP